MLLLKGENKRQSLILRTCSLLLAIIMVVSIAVPPVQAEDAGKQSVIENRKNEMKEQSILEQLQTETEKFTVENIKNAGVKDENFAVAIYESISKDPNNFRERVVLNDDGEIVEEGEVVTAEQIIEKGKAEGVTDRIKLILSYFTGKIEAEAKKITGIDGIKLLRRAWIIDLKNNDISSLMPLKWGENYIFSMKPSDEQMRKYFGEYHEKERKYRNTRIYIKGNPIKEYPSKADGCLKIDDNIEEDIEILPKRNYVIETPNNGENGIKIPNFIFDLRCDGNPIKVEEWGLEIKNIRNGGDKLRSVKNEGDQLSLVDDYKDKELGPVGVQGIRRNQEFNVAIPTASSIKTFSAGITNGSITGATTTFKWFQEVQTQLYTKLTVEKDTKNSVRIVKVDELNPKIVLPGAEFTLYDKDGRTLEVKETDEDGEIVFEGLKPGEYTVKETKAPKGYEENSSVSKAFKISEDNSSISANSKTGNKIRVYAGDYIENGEVKEKIEERKLENGVFVKCEDPSEEIGLSVQEGGESRLKSLNVHWFRGTLKEEREGSAFFDIKYDDENGSSNASQALEEVNKLVQEKTKDKYQNTEVTAVFENVDEDKKPLTFTFANKPKTGELKIHKTVENPEEVEINKEKTFKFQVDLIRENLELEGEYPYSITNSDNQEMKNGNLKSGDIIELKDNETIVIKNIPVKTQYAVKELLQNKGKYYYDDEDKKYYDVSGKIEQPKHDENGDISYDKKEIKGNTFEGEIVEDTTVSIETINKIVAYKLSVYKEDGNQKSLEDAEFTLYRESKEGENPDKTINVDGEMKDVIKYQSGRTTLGGLLAENNEKLEDSERMNIAFVTFNKLLPNTTWYLEETWVPSGHQIMQKILTVHVNENGVIEVKGKEEVHGEVKEGYLETSKVEGRENEFYITLTNKLNLIIPKAGMGGVYWYTIIGTLLIAAAAVTGAMTYRRKRNY